MFGAGYLGGCERGMKVVARV
ncbi:MAG: hypothetical protein LPK06_07100 [Marinobacter sp.]|nr:hypothetical protein [Marinobacter sp.]